MHMPGGVHMKEIYKFVECRNSANTSAFSLIILVGTSWHVLDVSKFKISLSISSLHISENEKASRSFFGHFS